MTATAISFQEWQWALEAMRAPLVKRIRGLNDLRMRTFTVAGIFHGTPPHVAELIERAIRCCEGDQFEQCARWCDRAEQAMREQRRQ